MSKYIVSNSKILAGEPVIAGTRIPVIEFLSLLKEGHAISDIHGMYPHVAEETFEAVLEELADSVSATPARYAA